MSYPWAEHDVFQDLSPEGGGRHLRCLLVNPDSIMFIALSKPPPLPEWMPRKRAEAMTEERELVGVDAAAFEPTASQVPGSGFHDGDGTAPWGDWAGDGRVSRERAKLQAKIADQERWSEVIALLIAVPNEAYLDPYQRGPAVAEAAATHGIRADKVHYWCRRYYQAGRSLSGLARDYRLCGRGRSPDRPAKALLGRPRVNLGETRGRKSGLNVTPEVAGHFKWAANRYMRGKMTWQRCFQKMLDRHYRVEVKGPDGQKAYLEKDVPLPTFSQFYAHVQRKIGLGTVTQSIVGPTAYEMDHAPRTSTSSRLALGPAHHYAIDATLVNQYVLSEDRTSTVGRPILYLVIDYYTHMIVGFYLGLENPSWTPASLALANAIGSKKDYCRSLSVPFQGEDWPAEHVPRTLSVDRASELVGNDMGRALSQLGIVHIICPPARPDRKGLVENAMQLIEIDLTNPDSRALHPRKMEDRPLPGDATLTLRELELKFVHWIRKHNSIQRIGRKQWPAGFAWTGKASALQLWDYGCKNARAPQKKSPLEVALALLRHETVTAVKEGFHLGRKLYYETDDPEVQSLLHRRRGKPSAKLQFLRDDRTVSRGLILFKGRLIQARLCQSCWHARNLSMFEFQRRYREDAVAEAGQAIENRAMEQRLANEMAAIDAAAAGRQTVAGRPVTKPGGIPVARRAEVNRIHKAAVAQLDNSFQNAATDRNAVTEEAGDAGPVRLTAYPEGFLDIDDE